MKKNESFLSWGIFPNPRAVGEYSPTQLLAAKSFMAAPLLNRITPSPVPVVGPNFPVHAIVLVCAGAHIFRPLAIPSRIVGVACNQFLVSNLNHTYENEENTENVKLL